MENPMWGGDLDDENTLQNLILPSSNVVTWPPTPMPTETLSNEEIPSSPFSEFFLTTTRNFSGENADTSLNTIFGDTGDGSGAAENEIVDDDNDENLRRKIVGPSSMPIFCHISSENNKNNVSSSSGSNPSSAEPFCNSSTSTCNNVVVSRNNDTTSKKDKKRKKFSFTCDLCSFSSTDRHELMVHKRSKHSGEKLFSCPDCPATFTRSYSMKRHVLHKHQTSYVPSPQLPKYCPFPGCSYVTRNANSMQIHKRSHHQQKNVSMYYCKQCKSRYSRRQYLLKHLTQKHSSNAALIGIITANAITLDVAVTNGQTVKPVVDHDDDDEDDSANENVIVENPTTVEKLYNCDKCQFTSKNFLDVYRHKQSVQHDDDEKQLFNKNVCLYCHKKFASSNGLLTHIKKQHLDSRQKTKKMYYCSKCSFSTRRKKVLKAHEDNSHFVAAMNQICYTVGTPMRRSPPKSDRNSVNSDGAYVNFGTSSTGSQIFASDLQSTPSDVCCRLPPLPPPPPPPQPSYGGNGGGLTSTASANGQQELSSFCQVYTLGAQTASTSTNNSFNPPAINNGGTCTSNGALNTFDELAFSMQHIQQANCHLLNLCRRRENELNNLRTNVMELLKRIYPNNLNFFDQQKSGCFSLENVDQLVVKAINDKIFQ